MPTNSICDRMSQFSAKKAIFFLIVQSLLVPFGLSEANAKNFTVLERNPTSYRSIDTDGKIVAVGSDEVVVGWRSKRAGVAYSNIYLQRMTTSGEPLWAEDANPVGLMPNNQGKFDMIPDGYGGVIVVWEDSRSENGQEKIFAQRINIRGEALWDRDGVQICEQPGRQLVPKIISDRKNGFFLIWEDGREGRENLDIYAQHINLDGKINWKFEGQPICRAPQLQQNFKVCSDGNNGLFVLWEDFRSGTFWNLYAQHFNSDGELLWPENGIDLFGSLSENQKNPDLIPDGLGGFVFVYQRYGDNTRGYDIARGRVKENGSLAYQFSVCYSIEDQINPVIVQKGKDAIIAWEDYRYGTKDIYGQMIGIQEGLIKWEPNGKGIAKWEGEQSHPQVVTSVIGNYQVFIWESIKEGKVSLHASRVDQYGEPVWSEGSKALCEVPGGQDQVSVLPVDGQGFWCSWRDSREQFGNKIYLQSLDPGGKFRLQSEGVELASSHSGIYAKIEDLQIEPAQNGDFFLAWKDYRNGEKNPDIYLQRIDASGKPVWKEGGIDITPVVGEQSRPTLVNDGAGGLIVCWVDRRNGRDVNLYTQRISSRGLTLWRANGELICDAPKSQSYVKAVTDGREGVIVAWSDARNLMTSGFDLYIQRINFQGKPLWGENGKPFARYPGLQSSPSLISDDNSGAYIAWMDMRNEVSNIYIQHINQYGIYEWEYGGRCPARVAYNQRNPQIVKNFQDDLYLVWEDSRLGDGNDKVVMQCLTPNGFKVWGSGGKLVCDNPGKQTSPKLLTDQSGNMWTTWLDTRNIAYNGQQLMAQKYDISGDPQWEKNGVLLGSELQEYNEYTFCLNAKGYSYYCWNSATPSGAKHVFYQKIRPDGMKKLNMDGIEIGAMQREHLFPVIGISTDGVVVISWVENKNNDWRVVGMVVVD